MDQITKIRGFAEMLGKLRAFLEARGLVEVFTETMVPAGAFEASIDVITASFRGGKLELHTSPEIEMKRLIAELKTSVYQICKCYRDDPPTGIHWREFTMLEFYRVGADYHSLLQDMKDLLETVAGTKLDFAEYTMRQAIRNSTDIDIDIAGNVAKLRAAIQLGNTVALSDDDTWDEMVFKLLIEKVEPSFKPHRPTILRDYPPSMCALAKLGPLKNVTERFEIYWHGMELCNGCTELDDFAELRRRFEVETANRERRGLAPHPFPARLAEAFTIGMPPMAGVAVGLDRLFLCLSR